MDVPARGLAQSALVTAGSVLTAFKNKLINGNFDLWQRGTVIDINFTDAIKFLADRWFTCPYGSNATVSRQSFTLGQSAVPNNPAFYHRINAIPTIGDNYYTSFHQRIESVRSLAGKTVTLSFWAKADGAKPIAVDFGQVFGAGGSPENSFGAKKFNLTASWAKYTYTLQVPTISGKVIGTDNNDYIAVRFWLEAGANWNSCTDTLGQRAILFDVAQIQLEEGALATSFELRPPAIERGLSQRYAEANVFTGFYYPTTGAMNIIYVPITFQTYKRTNASFTIPNGVSCWRSGDGVHVTATNVVINAVWPQGVQLQVNTTSGIWGVCSFNYFADAEIL